MNPKEHRCQLCNQNTENVRAYARLAYLEQNEPISLSGVQECFVCDDCVEEEYLKGQKIGILAGFIMTPLAVAALIWQITVGNLIPSIILGIVSVCFLIFSIGIWLQYRRIRRLTRAKIVAQGYDDVAQKLLQKIDKPHYYERDVYIFPGLEALSDDEVTKLGGVSIKLKADIVRLREFTADYFANKERSKRF